MISSAQALAARRAALAASALGATLGAHAAATGGLHLTRAAPFAWGWIILAATICGSRGARFAPRSPLVTLLMLAGLQAGLHLTMTAAPWAFGIAGHHHAPPAGPTAIAAHAAAAVLLAWLLLRGERLLDAAVRMVRAIRRAMRARDVRPLPARTTPIASAALSHGHRPLAIAPTRGPPLSIRSDIRRRTSGRTSTREHMLRGPGDRVRRSPACDRSRKRDGSRHLVHRTA